MIFFLFFVDFLLICGIIKYKGAIYSIAHCFLAGASSLPKRVMLLITCKLCNTKIEKKRKDGSMQCPRCLQVYWKAAVEKAEANQASTRTSVETYRRRFEAESRRTVASLRARKLGY